MLLQLAWPFEEKAKDCFFVFTAVIILALVLEKGGYSVLNSVMNWNTVMNFAGKGNPEPDQKIEKTEATWKEQLSPEAFRVARQKGTESPFSSEMCNLFQPGRYACICCDTLLFDSGEKFDSGTGWPSFTQPVKENAVAYHEDVSHGMSRIEALCNTCDAHLGHVFPDGPEPSGLRYCINAVALKKQD